MRDLLTPPSLTPLGLTPLGLLPPVLLPLVLGLAACGPADNDPGPGGVTVGEARALDEAAEMIEQRRPPANVLPAPSAPAPSPSAAAAP